MFLQEGENHKDNRRLDNVRFPVDMQLLKGIF